MDEEAKIIVPYVKIQVERMMITKVVNVAGKK